MEENARNSAQAETRKLAAIMFTDIVGFSRQMGTDEARMLRVLEVHNQVIQHAVVTHSGHVIKTMGDAFLVDFPSVVNAVWSGSPQTLERAFELAQKAVALDDSLPVAHVVLGDVYQWKKQHEHAIAEAERAITLNSNCAICYAELGQILNAAGQPEEAIGLIEKGMRLDPQTTALYAAILGRAYRLTGRYEEAIATLKKTLSFDSDRPGPHAELAVIYSELGREEEARAEAAEILRIIPNFSLEVWRQRLPTKDPADIERFLDGLRKAGLK